MYTHQTVEHEYGECAYDLLQPSYNTRLCKKERGVKKEEKHEGPRWAQTQIDKLPRTLKPFSARAGWVLER